MTYTIHTDPGHGWLETTIEEVERLNIADKITHYSYRQGDRIFLGEDCDLATFVKAKESVNEAFNYTVLHLQPLHAHCVNPKQLAQP